MGCCGQKRDSLKGNTFPSAGTSSNRPRSSGELLLPRVPHGERSHSPVAAGSSVTEGTPSIALQYTETSRVVVEGPVTGRRYEFSADRAIQMVDSRDVTALLTTRFFRKS